MGKFLEHCYISESKPIMWFGWEFLPTLVEIKEIIEIKQSKILYSLEQL